MANLIIEEYKNLLNKRMKIELSLSMLPYGYITQKTIKGKNYSYLQWRVSGKVVSRYLKVDEIETITKQIALRKQQETELPSIIERLSKLEQAALLIDKNSSRELMRLKISAGMDDLDLAQKRRSSSFAGAMNAIEGIPISRETKQDIAQWQAGNKSFLSVFETTLKRYGFPTEV